MRTRGLQNCLIGAIMPAVPKDAQRATSTAHWHRSYFLRRFWQIIVIEVSYILERIFIFLKAQLITHLVVELLFLYIFADYGLVAAYYISIISVLVYTDEPPFVLVYGWRYPLLSIVKGGSFSIVSTLRLYSSTRLACGFLYESREFNRTDHLRSQSIMECHAIKYVSRLI